MIRLYDAHNHLHDERLANRIDSILAGLPALGVKRCVVNGTCETDWPAVASLAQRFDWIIPAFGLHPWFAKDRTQEWFDTLRRYLDDTPRAMIGEIGLDRWMKEPDVTDQEKVFVAQLELAAERNAAASIHCLKAWGHLEDILKTHPRPARGFLLHSFGGSAEVARSLAKLGAFFSISGYFARDQKAAQREIFKTIPLDRILVETDAPDMLPPPQLISHPAGDVNDPRNLPKIYEFAAGVFGMPLEAFAGRVETNFTSLFC
jgi:TatD DNase family protein